MTPQTILITGATGAIGSALALAYAAPGRVLLLHGRKAARLAEVAQACESQGARTETKALDVRDKPALTAWLDEAARRQPVDLAIVNAGTINVLRPGDKDEAREDVERVMDVNVRAAEATVNALLPHMQRRGSGQIALISSLLGWFGLPVAPAYSASKAALKRYGEGLREPLARDGIRVSVVMPGFVKSDMSDELHVPKLFMVSAEDAARRIKRGLENNEARISFPFPLDLGSWLLATLPAPLQRLVLTVMGFDRR
jgi:short-subunit dehydrogenase